MKKIFKWSKTPPPKSTWVWASYENDDWQIVKTCKHGCCVQSLFGSMMLPSIWYLATEDEGNKEQDVWSSIKPIDLANIYSRSSP